MSKRKAEAVVELEGRKFPSDSDINEPDKWGLTLVNPSKWKEAQDTDPLVTLQSLSFHCYSFSASWTSEMLRLKVTFICPTYIVQLALSHQSTTNIVQEDGWRTLKFSRSIKKKKKKATSVYFSPNSVKQEVHPPIKFLWCSLRLESARRWQLFHYALSQMRQWPLSSRTSMAASAHADLSLLATVGCTGIIRGKC